MNFLWLILAGEMLLTWLHMLASLYIYHIYMLDFKILIFYNVYLIIQLLMIIFVTFKLLKI